MDNHSQNCLKFLQKMVSTPSLTKHEQIISKIVAAEMKKLNYDSVKIDKLGSVVGRIGNGKKKIVYDAHTDTVGVADLKHWKTNPFKAVLKNGIIYGRGACDDKGCVAAMVYAGALIKKQGLLGDFTLYVSASVREESADHSGIGYLIRNLGFKPDCVIIGEPSNLKVVRGHKGRAEMKVTVNGKSCHASVPEKGDNAIYKTLPFIKQIELLNKNYKVISELGKPVISVTQIETKSASTNTIPDNCSFYIDRRPVESETETSVLNEIRKIFGKNAKVEYLKKYSSAFILPKEHKLVQSSVLAYKKAYNKNPNVVLWPFCTNGSFTMGEEKIPTIGFGPGEEKYCHVPNEQIRTSDVLESIKFYSLFPLMFSKR
ncbi:MAG: YgeY family selenium metabolism-linked hydrolase [Elusimicrobia bacterium]|nr:YgeY family selenium metabolism-linked hydrolase [Elusimicrobiota bacterium]